MANIKIDANIFNKMYIPYVMDYSKRYEVYKGSAGSGKSYYVTQKTIIKALQSKRKVLVMRKLGNTLKTSVWQLYIDVLQQFKLYDKCTIIKSDMTIELPNGSVFLFKGLDDPEKIKSITGITDIVCEECTEFTVDDISQLDLRLREKTTNLQMFFMFNPISKENWTYSYFKFTDENQTQRIRTYDTTIVYCSTYKDNKFLNKEYIQSLESLKETNYTYYQIYCLGLFCTLDKLIYNNYEMRSFNYKDILRNNPTAKTIYGLDFGYTNDPTALICAVVDPIHLTLYIFDEMYEKGLLNNEIADRLKAKSLTKEIITADSAEKKSIEEIKKAGIRRIKPCRKGKGSILQGIQKIQQYKIIIHPSCKNTIMEFKNYTWKKDRKSGEYINEPIDSFNHLMDALRYAMQEVKQKAKILNIKF